MKPNPAYQEALKEQAQAEAAYATYMKNREPNDVHIIHKHNEKIEAANQKVRDTPALIS